MELNARTTGTVAGFTLSYAIFTTLLYVILNWRHTVWWGSVMGTTALLMIVGEELRRWFG